MSILPSQIQGSTSTSSSSASSLNPNSHHGPDSLFSFSSPTHSFPSLRISDPQSPLPDSSDVSGEFLFSFSLYSDAYTSLQCYYIGTTIQFTGQLWFFLSPFNHYTSRCSRCSMVLCSSFCIWLCWRLAAWVTFTWITQFGFFYSLGNKEVEWIRDITFLAVFSDSSF